MDVIQTLILWANFDYFNIADDEICENIPGHTCSISRDMDVSSYVDRWIIGKIGKNNFKIP